MLRASARSEAGIFLQGTLQIADGVLDLAFDLVALAVGHQLAITDCFAGRYLDGTFGLLARVLSSRRLTKLAAESSIEPAERFA